MDSFSFTAVFDALLKQSLSRMIKKGLKEDTDLSSHAYTGHYPLFVFGPKLLSLLRNQDYTTDKLKDFMQSYQDLVRNLNSKI
jgi:hypothetical protein